MIETVSLRGREKEGERENGELIGLVNKTREREIATPDVLFRPLLHNVNVSIPNQNF